MYTLRRSQMIDRPLDQTFAFFSDAANLQAITPGFLKFKILTPLPLEMRRGAKIEYRISLFGVPIHWRTNISLWQPGEAFVDEQVSGPFALWRHRHTFTEKDGGTLMEDFVDYKEPLGPLGKLAHHVFVRRTLDRIFDYRAERIAALLS